MIPIMNIKKFLMIFAGSVIILAIVMAGCSGGRPPDETTEGTTKTPKPAIEGDGIERVTDADGSPVTTIIYDADGNGTAHYLYKKTTQHTESNDPTGGEDPTGETEEDTIIIIDDDSVYEHVRAIADALNTGNFHFVGRLDPDDESAVMDITIFEANCRLMTELDGIKLDVRMIDGSIFFINKDKKTYAELSKAIAATYNLDLSAMDISSLTDQFKANIDVSATPEMSTAVLNGRNLTYYTYTKDSGTRIRFYFDGDTCVRLDIINSDGTVASELDVVSIAGNITKDDVMIPADYKSQNILLFMVDFIKNFTG